MAIDAHNFYFQ